MAIIDWPNTDAFRPVLPYSFGVSTPKSGSRGFYTGESESAGHLADRLLCSVTLPPCSQAEARMRSAMLIGALSNGDFFRFSPWGYRRPNGTISGSPVVAVSATAAARSLQISGALSAPNLLLNSGFEIDTNADGVADLYSIYYDVLPSNLSKGFVGGNGSLNAQRYTADITAGHDLGINRSFAGIVAGQQYSFSVDVNSNSLGLTPLLYVGWYNSGGTFISDSTITGTPATGWVRWALTATAPAGAVTAILYLWHRNTTGATIFGASGYADNMQLQLGSATPYAGLPSIAGGDVFSVGGNLIMAAYPGVSLNDAGTGSVPLALPLLADVASATAVSYIDPLGLWQIDTTDGISFDFAASVVQRGVTIPFRQRKA